MSEGTPFRLYELQEQISDALGERFSAPLRVVAEIAKFNTNFSGHTYFELVEKQGDKVIAQAKATVWKSKARILADFERVTRQPLRSGMEVLLSVKVDFHAVYCLSLNIQEIGPNYTLGDLARKRQEVINRLAEEELLLLNKRLALPLVPQRLAIVSSATAAGYQDFIRRLESNPFGYCFYPTLFSATVQGDSAEASILSAFTSIRRVSERFDCVILIRGGGGAVDLSCFDGYPLARAIAEFPIPVITGIGHDQDEAVADLVSFHNAATPTAAAEFVIAKARAFEDEVESIAVAISKSITRHLRDWSIDLDRVVVRLVVSTQNRAAQEQGNLERLGRSISSLVRKSVAVQTTLVTGLATRLEILPKSRLREQAAVLTNLEVTLSSCSLRTLERARSALLLFEKEVTSSDPKDVLRRGFSITRHNGKAVRNVKELKAGNVIETRLYGGRISSTISDLMATSAETTPRACSEPGGNK